METLSHMRPWPCLQSPAARQTQRPFGLYLAVFRASVFSSIHRFRGLLRPDNRQRGSGGRRLTPRVWKAGDGGAIFEGSRMNGRKESRVSSSAHRLPLLVCDVSPSIATQLVGAAVFRIKSLETRCRLPGLCGSRRDCGGVCCVWFPQRTVTSQMPKVVFRCKRGGQGCGKRE